LAPDFVKRTKKARLARENLVNRSDQLLARQPVTVSRFERSGIEKVCRENFQPTKKIQ